MVERYIRKWAVEHIIAKYVKDEKLKELLLQKIDELSILSRTE